MHECSDQQRAIDAFQRERAKGWKGASLQIPDGVQVRMEVPYSTVGDRQLTTDLFIPPESFTEPRPAMLYIHGGSWRGGSPTQFYRHAAQLAGHGIVGSCCRYRFSGEATFPASVEDVKAAIRWLRASAEELGIDRDRIGVLGGSSGGHLAAMLATTADVVELEGDGGYADQPSDVQLAVLLNPITDMTAFEAGTPLISAVKGLMGGLMCDIPDAYELASPLLQIDENTPPCLLVHGTADPLVPCEQSSLACGLRWWQSKEPNTDSSTMTHTSNKPTAI